VIVTGTAQKDAWATSSLAPSSRSSFVVRSGDTELESMSPLLDDSGFPEDKIPDLNFASPRLLLELHDRIPPERSSPARCFVVRS
jgi:hypothetical protein